MSAIWGIINKNGDFDSRKYIQPMQGIEHIQTRFYQYLQNRLFLWDAVCNLLLLKLYMKSPLL